MAPHLVGVLLIHLSSPAKQHKPPFSRHLTDSAQCVSWLLPRPAPREQPSRPNIAIQCHQRWSRVSQAGRYDVLPEEAAGVSAGSVLMAVLSVPTLPPGFPFLYSSLCVTNTVALSNLQKQSYSQLHFQDCTVSIYSTKVCLDANVNHTCSSMHPSIWGPCWGCWESVFLVLLHFCKRVPRVRFFFFLKSYRMLISNLP